MSRSASADESLTKMSGSCDAFCERAAGSLDTVGHSAYGTFRTGEGQTQERARPCRAAAAGAQARGGGSQRGTAPAPIETNGRTAERAGVRESVGAGGSEGAIRLSQGTAATTQTKLAGFGSYELDAIDLALFRVLAIGAPCSVTATAEHCAQGQIDVASASL